MVQPAKVLQERKETIGQIRALMFAGEAFFHDQRVLVQAAFPFARIRSLVYGSVGSGVMGYSASNDDWRFHRVNSPFVELEICPGDEDGVPTTDSMIPGRLLVTNLVLDRADLMDSLTIHIRYRPPDLVKATNTVVAKLMEQRPMLQQHVDLKLISPLQVEFVDAQDLKINSRAGKLEGLVDQRQTEDGIKNCS